MKKSPSERPKSKARAARARMSGKIAEFLRCYRRKSGNGGRDPNDRDYDRELEARIKRMSPLALDALMRGDEEQDER